MPAKEWIGLVNQAMLVSCRREIAAHNASATSTCLLKNGLDWPEIAAHNASATSTCPMLVSCRPEIAAHNASATSTCMLKNGLDWYPRIQQRTQSSTEN
ncbi:hypothetical protein QE152_g40764 [Popillia japonica]|uniref:Uncharacterized protein n=1 Tax=Popillia japonica TaxID=7064 RepID=A0AAW1HFG9_POPJA